MTKKIISFSLWGDNPKYTIGAIRNAELAKDIYPGWQCHFYVGGGVSPEIIKGLLDRDALVIAKVGGGWNGTFWRFESADSDDIFISRDTDSRLGSRERAAVDEWLAGDRDFHIMRDHPYHNTEILAGMWGCRNGILKGIKEWMSDYDMRDYDGTYQNDQNFLREVVYPLVRGRDKVHDDYFESLPFPTRRENPKDFVGQVYDEYDTPVF
jgi:hypothetical protein